MEQRNTNRHPLSILYHFFQIPQKFPQEGLPKNFSKFKMQMGKQHFDLSTCYIKNKRPFYPNIGILKNHLKTCFNAKNPITHHPTTC
jgi:hypothetical protein